MSVKICRYCEQEFQPSRYHPDQDVCSSKQCQRQRRTDYHRKKLEEDPIYREQCRDSQRKWRERNPDYMKRYLSNRQEQKLLAGETSPLATELERLLSLVKNNLAFDLKPSTAAMWFVHPHTDHKKNIFANAKLLALQGTLYVLFSESSKKNISLKRF
jgi:hypothetical protein